jgi:thioredoxin reductase (NADPH)
MSEFLRPEGTDPTDVADAFSHLEPALIDRLERYGEVLEMQPGTVLYLAGRDEQELFFVLRGAVEILGYAPVSAESDVLVRYAPGEVGGELALLTGQKSFVTAQVTVPSTIRRFSSAELRRIMDEETELSDALLRMFVARRELLRSGVVANSIEIIGDSHSSASLELRSYAARQGVPHLWFDSESETGRRRMVETGLTSTDLPMVYSAKGVFPSTTPGELADVLGLTFPAAGRDVELLVIGAGPAGMAAAVYGASEGLQTVVLDAVSVGGQAAASARIENYLGFPSGISGAELLRQSTFQAEKFGAQIYTPCRVERLDSSLGVLRIELSDGAVLAPRAVIIASGAKYRALPVDRWDEFEMTSIYYAATDIEVRECAGHPVVVVGGANSAGQAALHLAKAGSDVTIVVRGDIRAKMSSYLVDRVIMTPQIHVLSYSEITTLHGSRLLEGVTVEGPDGEQLIDCMALFCFAGATPQTEWLSDIGTDAEGFILTDTDVTTEEGDVWANLGRDPLPFETTTPMIFAVGDVRHGSMKRVAAAVGEGASAVHSVHRGIGWT